jgi:hypothetical protein
MAGTNDRIVLTEATNPCKIFMVIKEGDIYYNICMQIVQEENACMLYSTAKISCA